MASLYLRNNTEGRRAARSEVRRELEMKAESTHTEFNVCFGET